MAKQKRTANEGEHWIVWSAPDALTICAMARALRQQKRGETIEQPEALEEVERLKRDGAEDSRGDQSLAYLLTLDAEQLGRLESETLAGLAAGKAIERNEPTRARAIAFKIMRRGEHRADGECVKEEVASHASMIPAHLGRTGALASCVALLATMECDGVVLVPPPMMVGGSMLRELFAALRDAATGRDEGERGESDRLKAMEQQARLAAVAVPGSAIILKSALLAWIAERGGWPAGVPTLRDALNAVASGGHAIHQLARCSDTAKVLAAMAGDVDACVNHDASKPQNPAVEHEVKCTRVNTGTGLPLAKDIGDRMEVEGRAWMRQLADALRLLRYDARKIERENVPPELRDRWLAECAALDAADSMASLVDAVEIENKGRNPEGGAR